MISLARSGVILPLSKRLAYLMKKRLNGSSGQKPKPIGMIPRSPVRMHFSESASMKRQLKKRSWNTKVIGGNLIVLHEVRQCVYGRYNQKDCMKS